MSDVITINTENWKNEPVKKTENFIIYDLVKSDDSNLYSPLPEFDFANPPISPVELASNLVETCKKYNGIGLSANQCGLPFRVFVAGIDTEFVAFFNPKLISASDNLVNMQEGCLSYPNLFLNIKRPDRIDVEYQDYLGQTKTTTFTGITARCFLHELDHMNGIVYTSKVGPLALQMATKRKKKHERMATRISDRILKANRISVPRV
jgi:peptide deformylase